jgi:uncharacterized repeat protein (TIGR03803 family)
MIAIRYSATRIAVLILTLIMGFTSPLLAAGPPETGIYNFGVNGFGDAVYPAAGLVADAAGNLYGTGVMGGAIGNGAVFKLSPPATAGGAWTETLLYSFGTNSDDGNAPDSTLVFDAAGNLYGTTESGGAASGLGTVFQLSPPSTSGGAWSKTTIYSFPANRLSGVLPVGKLALDPAGNLYGVTQSGGSGAKCLNSQGCGVVYKLSPPATSGAPWTQTVLHNFGSTKQDGVNPLAGVLYRGGNLFGTTWLGGVTRQGMVYVLVPSGTAYAERILHSFDSFDGAGPTGGLIADSANNLYGTTDAGGSSVNCGLAGCGTVFQLAPPAAVGGAWTLTTLYSFNDGRDGANPLGALWRSQAGDLYGTANNGGITSGPAKDSGTFFRLNHPAVAGGAWTLATLHAFSGFPTDGSDPQAEVILKNHVFYGVTVFGGTNDTGTVFSVGP